MWDGVADSTRNEREIIRIEAGRIVAIDRDPSLSSGALDIPLDGAVAIPGLIDAHVHLCLDPAWRRGGGEVGEPRNEVHAAALRRASEMVAAGITTARDLGGGSWIELEVRDRIAGGEVAGPRILCAGQPVTSPGGHCHFWGGEAETREEIRTVIDRQVAHGADWIKVMATGGVLTAGSKSAEPQFSQLRLSALVRHAAHHDRRVAAHCHGTRGIARAAGAGVHTVEHCSFAGEGGFGADLDPAVVDRLAASGTAVAPTVNLGWGSRARKSRKPDRPAGAAEGEPSGFFTRMSHCLRALVAAGVPLVASTDAGIPGVAHHRLAESLPVLGQYAGLAPAAVLRAATSGAARALGLEHETGRLVPGLAADVLVLATDPLRDLAVLQRPVAVLARGQRVREPGS